MGLRDELPKSEATRKCPVRMLAQVLPPDVGAEFIEIVNDDMVQSVAIAKLCGSKNWPVSLSALRRHRRKECSC